MSQQNELHEPVHRREEENGFFRFFVFFISKENGFFAPLNMQAVPRYVIWWEET